jgi:lactoylglutathione lyase
MIVIMKFCWSTLKVKNMDESLKFYQEIVGLSVNKRFNAEPGVEIAFLGDGETKIELICDENSKEVNVGQDISLGFEVKSVEEMMRFVKEKGIAIQSGPFQPNPHIKFFYVMDPNGLKIQFVENI